MCSKTCHFALRITEKKWLGICGVPRKIHASWCQLCMMHGVLYSHQMSNEIKFGYAGGPLNVRSIPAHHLEQYISHSNYVIWLYFPNSIGWMVYEKPERNTETLTKEDIKYNLIVSYSYRLERTKEIKRRWTKEKREKMGCQRVILDSHIPRSITFDFWFAQWL